MRVRISARAWCGTLAACVLCDPTAVSAQTPADATRIRGGTPAGFDALLTPQEAVVDVYIGGRAIGQTRVRYAAGKITFLDIDTVLGRIPDLIDPAAVRAALAAPDLDTNADLICAPEADVGTCGVLKPAVAGVIFDEARFRVDLFIDARQLAVQTAAQREYLPTPDARLSLVDQLGGTIAGSGGDADYTIQNRAILGYRNGRLRSELSYSSRYGLIADTLVAEVDKPGLRYAAGAMWAPGIDLTGRRKFVGVGMQSQIDTRLDRTSIAGTPLVVALALRSRVDILRDGRLLTSRIYDAGNQALDTSGLPDGAYEVILHVQEAGGASRDERRFFTKNAAIAAVGEPIVFAYAGLLANDRYGSLIAVSRKPFYEAGVARRLAPHLALDATVMGTDRTALVEVGGYWLTTAAQIRAAAVASVRGQLGVLFQTYSSGTAALSYALDLRRVWSAGDRPLIPVGEQRGYDVVTIDRAAQLSAGSFTQANATLGYTLRPGQIGISGFYRSDSRAARSYGIGPTAYFPLIERAGMQVMLRGDMTLSNRGTSAFLGLSFQRLRGTSSLTASLGGRSTSGSSIGSGAALVGDIGGSWQKTGVLGGNLALSGGLEREVAGSLARGHADLRAKSATIYADVAQPITGSNGATQYGLSFQTTAAFTGKTVVFQGLERSDSAILVSVDREADGAPLGAPFEVLVDNTTRGVVRAGRSLSVPVASYRSYAVRLRSVGDALMRVDGVARQVSVYPGTVARVRWSAQRVVAMFGRIVWADGTPVANAAVHASDAIGNTDDNGYFQIEAGSRSVLKVQAIDGRQCRLQVTATPSTESYAALGTLRCGHRRPGPEMADPTP
jgi:hypothetical protein